MYDLREPVSWDGRQILPYESTDTELFFRGIIVYVMKELFRKKKGRSHSHDEKTPWEKGVIYIEEKEGIYLDFSSILILNIRI